MVWDEKEQKTVIKRLVKGESPSWQEVYNKDGIVIHIDPLFGLIQLTTPGGSEIGENMVSMGRIVVFGEFYKGRGELEIHKPYILKN